MAAGEARNGFSEIESPAPAGVGNADSPGRRWEPPQRSKARAPQRPTGRIASEARKEYRELGWTPPRARLRAGFFPP